MKKNLMSIIAGVASAVAMQMPGTVAKAEEKKPEWESLASLTIGVGGGLNGSLLELDLLADDLTFKTGLKKTVKRKLLLLEGERGVAFREYTEEVPLVGRLMLDSHLVYRPGGLSAWPREIAFLAGAEAAYLQEFAVANKMAYGRSDGVATVRNKIGWAAGPMVGWHGWFNSEGMEHLVYGGPRIGFDGNRDLIWSPDRSRIGNFAIYHYITLPVLGVHMKHGEMGSPDSFLGIETTAKVETLLPGNIGFGVKNSLLQFPVRLSKDAIPAGDSKSPLLADVSVYMKYVTKHSRFFSADTLYIGAKMLANIGSSPDISGLVFAGTGL
ncbi:hypothetical protein HY501_03625 [Candidatus Woesearchaeota archaeon]|nr:hypothetical protein [Candidatus Woesearchaeota archaeon]